MIRTDDTAVNEWFLVLFVAYYCKYAKTVMKASLNEALAFI